MNVPPRTRAPQAVLFMCGQNSVRSPMAAALLRQMERGLYVQSAGVRPGEPNPFAVAVMEEIGIDISSHQPWLVDELEDWEGFNFDLIITLAPEAHHRALEMTATLAADVEETPKRGELPRGCATRLARAKADAALKSVQLDDDLRGAYILAADTVVAVGRRILPKAELVDEAVQCLRLLSGRNHRVYTAICLVTPKESFRQRLVETRVRFKRLTAEDIQAYIDSGEWRG